MCWLQVLSPYKSHSSTGSNFVEKKHHFQSITGLNSRLLSAVTKNNLMYFLILNNNNILSITIEVMSEWNREEH